MSVAMIGAGYVGLAPGARFADFDHAGSRLFQALASKGLQGPEAVVEPRVIDELAEMVCAGLSCALIGRD